MKPNIHDMLTFIEVVDTRSFTTASNRLGRSKSAISQTISRLEADMNTRLLQRSTRSLTLTDTGARFYDSCLAIKNAYNDALEGIWEDKGDPQGTLSITAPHALCAAVITPAIKLYLNRYPRMSVRLVAEDASIKLIEEHIDLAVRVGKLTGQTARVTKIGTLSESLYAHPDYIKAQGGIPNNLKALEKWDHIANEWQGNPVTYSLPQGVSFKVLPRARCNSLPDILKLTQSGLGIARLPDITATSIDAISSLIKVSPLGIAPIYALHQFDTKPPQRVRDFITLIREQLRSPSSVSDKPMN
ncbi:LysR family transcriptional regulator [uncultured Kiloniella sp.]|uniref:LysR family transcriptional regulator n=1 Tax=uncultured Kiloniella sp. TaxID=1133091 RepID=UPI002612821F|nr:LysR family transcriptional regulator [uncultured Kiloniella sp.]